MMTSGVMIDFSSAFDRLRYPILLQKLYDIGVKGNLMKWLSSYFNNQKIMVKKGNNVSNWRYMTQGTPQGSSLSGFIFCVYVNDIPSLLKHSKTILYADDMAMIVSGKTSEEIQIKLEEDLQILNNWCIENSMQINISKTKSILFKPKNLNRNDTILVKLDSKELKM